MYVWVCTLVFHSISAGQDYYMQSPLELTITSIADNRRCVNITSLNDGKVDKMESFMLVLQSSDPYVVLNPAVYNATVSIIDNSCKSVWLYICLYASLQLWNPNAFVIADLWRQSGTWRQYHMKSYLSVYNFLLLFPAALTAFVEMKWPDLKTTPRWTNNSTAFLCRSQTVVAETPPIDKTALLFSLKWYHSLFLGMGIGMEPLVPKCWP